MTMINKYKCVSVNHKDVVFDKEYNQGLDLVELIRIANSLNNQLVELKIRLDHIKEENKCLKQQIRELEFRGILK